jgi:hypothetical protein
VVGLLKGMNVGNSISMDAKTGGKNDYKINKLRFVINYKNIII